MKAKTIQLTKEIQIPQMGFGTSGLGNKATQSILHALQTGYRHIDTADIYGTHPNVAEAISKSDIAREQIFITTKLWSHSVSKDKVSPAVNRFLNELETEYIDLLLIHWPSNSAPVQETLAAMDQAKQAGKVRALGVSNFNVKFMKQTLDSGFEVCNDQIEYNLNHRPDDTVKFCQQQKVTVTAYSPLEEVTKNKTVAELAKKYDKPQAQVILNWLMQKDMLVIPRSTDAKHIETNFHSSEWSLENEDIEKLDNAR